MTSSRQPFGRLHRRSFIQGGACALALLTLPALPRPIRAQEMRRGFVRPQPAQFYDRLPNGKVKCRLCPRGCLVPSGERGQCGVRENRLGKYYTLAYGNPCAVHVDPIEKKPFFHVLPGSASFSIATAGCNLRCQFCQNWEISQARPEETLNFDLPPEQVVAAARSRACPSIAYTYVEPVIFTEYLLDTGRLARQAGILNTMHSNGYIQAAPLAKLCEVLDAAVIDLKAFEPAFYEELTDGQLQPVLETLKALRAAGVHLELVNLVIPQKNDGPESLARMCAWIRDELGPLTPLHFSRFYPRHKMAGHFPTPVSTLERARETALKAGLQYVYLGNFPGHPAESTACHGCGRKVIGRRGHQVTEVHLKEGSCRFCGTRIPGLWGRREAA